MHHASHRPFRFRSTVETGGSIGTGSNQKYPWKQRKNGMQLDRKSVWFLYSLDLGPCILMHFVHPFHPLHPAW